MDSLTIEYVCTGNNGRSPMAEAIAQDYARRQGLIERIKVASSGSGLHEKTRKTGDAATRQQLEFIQLALDNGIYRDTGRQEDAREVLQVVKDPIRIEELFKYAIRVEGILRDQALFEKGLVAAGEYHKPTTAWRTMEPWNEYLILPMAKSNADQVRQIYEDSRFKPIVKPTIAVLNEYAGLSGDVPNPFCQLLPAYQRVRDHLLVAVPKTVDRAVEEFLKTPQ